MAAASSSIPSLDHPEEPPESAITPAELPILDDAHIQQLLDEANQLKLEGNEHFRNQAWDQALAVYRSALGGLPKRRPRVPLKADTESNPKGKGRERDTGDSHHGNGGEVKPDETPADASTREKVLELTELERECAKTRAVLNSNIGACHVKLGDQKEVVAACSEALLDDPKYVRALQRRAAANEQIGSWSSLSSAQEDYQLLLEILPVNSPQLAETRRTIHSLKPRVEAAQKRETDEVVDKLKGLGNSILGNFGLSTDNFKFTPNEQGGYSMNFVR